MIKGMARGPRHLMLSHLILSHLMLHITSEAITTDSTFPTRHTLPSSHLTYLERGKTAVVGSPARRTRGTVGPLSTAACHHRHRRRRHNRRGRHHHHRPG